MGAVEVIEALTKPLNKLIDSVSGAIGKVYEPKHKRKMADATAYEIDRIGEALRNNSDAIITYNNGQVVETSPEFEEFVQRTKQRFGYQELLKQKNIEAVVDNAYEELEKVESVSEEPVNQDWMSRFFNCVEDIGDEDMQKLWGKVLAGEIKKPGSFSKRTLDVVKNLSSEEANAFDSTATYVLSDNSSAFLPSEKKLLDKYKVSYGTILLLSESGLIVSNGLISEGLTVSETMHPIVHYKGKALAVRRKGQGEVELSFGVYPLTQAGCELYKIIRKEPKQEYLFDFVETLLKDWEGKGIKITLHDAGLNDDGSICWQEEVLKEWETTMASPIILRNVVR